MPNLQHENEQYLIFDLADNPVIPNSVSPVPLQAARQRMTFASWVFQQSNAVRQIISYLVRNRLSSLRNCLSAVSEYSIVQAKLSPYLGRTICLFLAPAYPLANFHRVIAIHQVFQRVFKCFLQIIGLGPACSLHQLIQPLIQLVRNLN